MFCFVEFARQFRPVRPVYGLQALGVDGIQPRQSCVEEMAAIYAEEILVHQPQGPHHLLGQSAGGWYAHAVAAALLAPGGTIGRLAILDGGPTACIQPRLRPSLLLRSRPRTSLRFLAERFDSLRAHLKRLRRPAGERPGGEARREAVSQGDHFTRLHNAYSPQPLPVSVQLFSTPYDAPLKRHLWRAFACGGVRT